MRAARWIVGIGVLLALAAVVTVAGPRADRYQNHDWINVQPPDPTAGIGAQLPGTVIVWRMDAQTPLGWAIYRDEHGDYWRIRFAECDRLAGLTCPREILYSYPTTPTRTL